jgi:hypothetical protein
VYNERERDRWGHIFFPKKNELPPKNKKLKKKIKKCPVNRAQGWGALLPC